jgi:D-3-phosphoglycerate dehydrogenase
MADILITENIIGQAVESLKKKFDVDFEPDLWQSPDKLKETIRNYKAILVRNQTKITQEVIQAAPSLKVIGRAGAGLDNIDLEAATKAGKVVVYTPEQNSISVAELALGMMLSLARKINAADKDTKNGNWNRQQFTGYELYGKTLGIVGMGRIGYRTAVRAKAFGMKIIAHDEYANPDATPLSELQAPLVSLEKLLSTADFISCHLPLTPLTGCFFGYEKFSMMKPSAFFLNTSRGEVVDEKGLLTALEEKKIAGAALDVRQKEPCTVDAFSVMDNVILTPHIAAFTREGQNRVVVSVCQDITAVLEGKPAKNFFNFPVPVIEE